MGNFTASELFTIAIIILIVFGPNHLPEIARKAGALAARARSALDSLKTELNTEYGDAIAPLREARDELRAAGSDIKGQVAQFGSEIAAAGNELRGAAEDTVKPVTEAMYDADPAAVASPDSEGVSEGDTDVVRPPPQDGLELDGG